jgi:preprotein translocase subunit YajC
MENNMFNFFISSAQAADTIVPVATTTASTTAVAPQGGGMMQLVLLLGMVVVFYFLLWRPQSKRAKMHKDMVSNIKAGDEISTNGGMMGVVKSVADTSVKIQIAENTTIQIQKNSIAMVLPKGSVNIS